MPPQEIFPVRAARIHASNTLGKRPRPCFALWAPLSIPRSMFACSRKTKSSKGASFETAAVRGRTRREEQTVRARGGRETFAERTRIASKPRERRMRAADEAAEASKAKALLIRPRFDPRTESIWPQRAPGFHRAPFAYLKTAEIATPSLQQPWRRRYGPSSN